MTNAMYSSEAFYDKFSQSYANYAFTKNVYLLAVNKFIIQELKQPVKIIDIGSGDGRRSKKIADAIGASELTLLDSSPGMISLLKNIKGALVMLGDISNLELQPEDKFDVVTCLWNVLGHIPTNQKREVAMKNLKDLVGHDGLIFIDVNNRYNVSQYGIKNVIKNIFRDVFTSKENGDFELSLKIGEETIRTSVHIFSPTEMDNLIKKAGLKIIQKKIINYKTGKECKSIFGGQLVYKLSA